MTTEVLNVCSPITSISELYECIKTPPKWTDSIIQLKTRSSHVIKNTFVDCHLEEYNFFPKQRLDKEFVPKTLVCHDMKNGYLEDKYIGPVHAGNAYTFYRWSQIDIFVYFSHHLITVPPLSWINLSHKNGVPILGTFITEFDKGKVICDDILKDTKTLQSIADALVELCVLFRLDGWLLNIENKVENPENLRMFVRCLTDGLHKKKRGAYVIWYDSVTKEGDLKWQNELNEHNRCYFDLCDGIFLNYTWNEDNLKRTAKEAQHRILDVYVGLDVFGRGCFGGGQYNSYLAAKAVREHNLSLAIFAQGWTHETLDKEPEHNFMERFHQRDNIFWNCLWPYLYSHPIKYAFETTFDTGSDIDLYDLQAQTFQLTNFLSSDELMDTKNLPVLKDKCQCLKDNVTKSTKICRISNEFLEDGIRYIHRLFSTEIFLNGTLILYCYTKSLKACDYTIILLVQNKYKHLKRIVCKSSPQVIEDYKKAEVEVGPLRDCLPLRKQNVPDDWDLRAFEIDFYEDTLLDIGISLCGKYSIDLCGFGITIKE